MRDYEPKISSRVQAIQITWARLGEVLSLLASHYSHIELIADSSGTRLALSKTHGMGCDELLYFDSWIVIEPYNGHLLFMSDDMFEETYREVP